MDAKAKKKLQPLKHFWGRTYNGYKIIIMNETYL